MQGTNEDDRGLHLSVDKKEEGYRITVAYLFDGGSPEVSPEDLLILEGWVISEVRLDKVIQLAWCRLTVQYIVYH